MHIALRQLVSRSQPRADNSLAAVRWRCKILQLAELRKSFVLRTVGCMRGDPSRRRLFLSFQNQTKTVFWRSQVAEHDVKPFPSISSTLKDELHLPPTEGAARLCPELLVRKSRCEDTSAENHIRQGA